MSKTFEPTICIDFDGTLHRYSKGWQDGSCYDHYVPGAFAWLKAMCEHEEPRFKLVIYSSRSATPEGISAMLQWFGRESVRAVEEGELSGDFEFPIIFDRLEFANVKPPAWLTIDDRCIQFRGNWSMPELTPQNILSFKPWTSK